MRLVRLLCITALITPVGARAQGTLLQQHEATAPPPDARYEIVQSSFVARLTLRLDRFNGAVDQMMVRADSTIGWEPIVRRSHRDPDTQVAGRANYQIFTSGISIRFTFLMNVNTGATWQLAEDRTAGWFWTPIF